MSWFNDTAKSLSVVTKLMMHDREGLSEIDNSAAGFWGSFSAIILIAPLYLFISSINWAPDNTENATDISVAKHLVTLGIQWVLWPLIMVFAARWAGLGQFFTRYVIVYNWSNVLIITILSLPALLLKIGILPLETAVAFTGILQLLTFYVEWYLTRLSLETKGLTAAAIVLGNFVLSVGVLRIIG